MADLSPAAQAVLDVIFRKWMEIDDIDDDIPGKIAAAALRAAADQVVPGDYDPPRGVPYQEKEAFLDGKCARNEDIRAELLAIAAELEGANG